MGDIDLWLKLTCDKRRGDKDGAQQGTPIFTEVRVEAERDYDRSLFSTPVRRLADKTQVFPLESHDSVRNRLTHSLEVSNLARSFGVRLVAHEKWDGQLARRVPAMLAAAGLCHDIGNPPFGHQGEFTIQSWFLDNKDKMLEGLSDAQQGDFLKFEGNAQTFRLLTRLQHPRVDNGLDLTWGTLASLTKYPCVAGSTSSSHIATKKHGIFLSEMDRAEAMWEQTGLGPGKRHPFAYVIEACDDICYAMIDAEDSIKKSIASIHDLLSYLEEHSESDETVQNLVEAGRRHFKNYRKIANISSQELNDVSVQRLRVDVIGKALDDAFSTFSSHRNELMNGSMSSELTKAGKCSQLVKVLKDFDRLHGYEHRPVKELELKGAQSLRAVLGVMSHAILAVEETFPNHKRKLSATDSYLYSRISEGYRRAYEQALASGNADLPRRYSSCQLLTDAVSGMTDGYLLRLVDELRHLDLL
jgi:dGTPase